MRVLFIFVIIKSITCELWPKGIVHYDINPRDYDLHSRDEIMTVISRIEKEVCVKFFLTPINVVNQKERMLYISNPEQLKNCEAQSFDFNTSIVNLVLGYKCINTKDISRIVMDMLMASILEPPQFLRGSSVGQELAGDNLLTKHEKDHINKNYYGECAKLHRLPSIAISRRAAQEADDVLTPEAKAYYNNKIWPLGVVNYGFGTVDDDKSQDLSAILDDAMMSIESATCIMFHDVNEAEGGTQPNSMVLFEDRKGAEIPAQGIVKEKQVINLRNMTEGTPGHTAHVFMSLMRILGLPLESNRFDRGNYISVNWKNIDKGKELFFEVDGPESMLHMPYDYESVTHAPVNWWCHSKCGGGGQTIRPLQDHLWLRTMTLGHGSKLSDTDIKKISLIYGHECKKRKDLTMTAAKTAN